jgi:hypothetical protein
MAAPQGLFVVFIFLVTVIPLQNTSQVTVCLLARREFRQIEPSMLHTHAG